MNIDFESLTMTNPEFLIIRLIILIIIIKLRVTGRVCKMILGIANVNDKTNKITINLIK